MSVIKQEAVEQFCEAAQLNQTMSDKEKVDMLLQLDCDMYTRLGTDSTLEEKDQVKLNSRIIYQGISKINKEEGTLLLNSLDAS